MATRTRRAPKKAASANGTTPKSLPRVTPAKFKEALHLVERIVEEKTSVFVAKANDYRETHRQGTSRPLTAVEAAQITAAMADSLEGVAEDPGGAVASIQQSELRAYDEPGHQEVLMAAGVATAPEFVDAVQRMVALIEMPDEPFREARESETLDEVLEAAAKKLEYLDMETEARPRAAAALDHFSRAAGAGSGKGLALMAQTILAALGQAMSATTSTSSSSTSSLVDTGGTETAPSTGSPTETPSPT